MSHKEYYIAIDIGLSSGLHVALWVEDGKIFTKEIYRFENKSSLEDGSFYWDMDLLYDNVVEGLVLAKRLGIEPVSIGIDTWAIDYALVNRRGDLLGDVYAYLSKRTQEAVREVAKKCSLKELYQATGIQHLPFNTLYQLVADGLMRPNILNGAQRMLMIGEYLMFLLTGEMCNEYTGAATTGLLDVKTKTWDKQVAQKVGIPEKFFQKIVFPGEVLGELLPEVAAEVGFQTKVVVVATNDTASAVMGTPLEENSLYLSSGTWSLMGAEQQAPTISEESFTYNMSNEGGYGGTYRLQRNMMGLWLVQNLHQQIGEGRTFSDLVTLAQEELNFPSRIDVTDAGFFAPASMAQAIKDYCSRTQQRVPENLGQILSCVYHSLALNYQKNVEKFEILQGKPCDAIYIVGGGSQNTLLNQLTANACKRKVITGVVEASALGNGLCQMIRGGVFASLEEARAKVRESFVFTTYMPQ